MQTEESYYRWSPAPFSVTHLAGPATNETRYGLLGELDSSLDSAVGPDAVSQVNKLGDDAAKSQDVALMMSHIKLSLMVGRVSELPGLAEHFHGVLKACPLAEDPSVMPFADSGVHLVRRDDALVHRIKFASVWLRFQYDSKLREGETRHLNEGGEGVQAFASASGLYQGMLMPDVYFSTLIACLSPFVWGISVARPFGNILISLGSSLSGTKTAAAEILQTIETMGGREATPAPNLPTNSAQHAIKWWVSGLNGLFGVIADLANFQDSAGFYSPSGHMHAILSVEQLFRRVLSIQCSHRDTDARRVLLFTVLDTLQRLTGRSLEVHCSHRFAQKTLDDLESDMSPEAAAILLPRAARGVDALKRMQQGFFLGRDVGSVKLSIGREGDEFKVYDLDSAVAHYVKVLRDATHGHGSNREAQTARTNALLAQHDGDIPHEIGWLGYLYMLDLMRRPERLRSILRSRH